MNIENLGWNSFFAQHFEQFGKQDLIPARVAREQKGSYLIFCEPGELTAEISGKMRHQAATKAELPTVGDWVVINARPKEGTATINALLPRQTGFSRKAVLAGGMKDSGGRTEEQILAANIDTVFLVNGLDRDYNLRRIERYLAIAWDSGASPVIVLNKSDLCDDLESRVEEVKSSALGVPVCPMSAAENQGLDVLNEYLIAGRTAVFLGSSGVGKSTIINGLLGTDQLRVQEVREDDQRGRHTTTHRELIILPTGGIVIDTPGLREIQVWTDKEGLSRTFHDIEEFAESCRFRDCKHQGEPGCAVQQAIEDGTLDAKRFRNYLKLQKELEFLALRQEKHGLRQAQREFDKKIRQRLKELKKLNNKRFNR